MSILSTLPYSIDCYYRVIHTVYRQINNHVDRLLQWLHSFWFVKIITAQNKFKIDFLPSIESPITSKFTIEWSVHPTMVHGRLRYIKDRLLNLHCPIHFIMFIKKTRIKKWADMQNHFQFSMNKSNPTLFRISLKRIMWKFSSSFSHQMNSLLLFTRARETLVLPQLCRFKFISIEVFRRLASLPTHAIHNIYCNLHTLRWIFFPNQWMCVCRALCLRTLHSFWFVVNGATVNVHVFTVQMTRNGWSETWKCAKKASQLLWSPVDMRNV